MKAPTTAILLLMLGGAVIGSSGSRAAADDAVPSVNGARAVRGEPGAAAEPETEEAEEADEAAASEGDDFCGGEEDTGDVAIWQAEESLANGDARSAARDVIAALDDGTIHGATRRARAWQLVGEARLRQGQYRRAERAYLRAFRIEQPSPEDPARVGLAMARMGRRERTIAREDANAFVSAACDGDEVDNVPACYGARRLLAALVTDDARVRDEQMAHVRALRGSTGDAAVFASMDDVLARIDAR